MAIILLIRLLTGFQFLSAAEDIKLLWSVLPLLNIAAGDTMSAQYKTCALHISD